MRPEGTYARKRRWPLALALPIATAGCLSGPAPRDHYYRLEANPPRAMLDSPCLPGALEVGRFRSDALTSDRMLVVREGSDAPELHRHAYHLWVDSPPTMLQHALAAYLRAAGAADRVVTPEMRVEPDFLLAGRILRLERILEGSPGSVVVEVELTVTRGEGNELVALRTYREERTPKGSGVSQAIVAFNRALTAIFERFLSDLSES